MRPPIEIGTDGRGRIALERRRQINAEGWTQDHDDQHTDGELLAAARCYATPPDERDLNGALSPEAWPWSATWWKPKDRMADLVRAGALALAECERLNRAGRLRESVAALDFAERCGEQIDQLIEERRDRLDRGQPLLVEHGVRCLTCRAETEDLLDTFVGWGVETFCHRCDRVTSQEVTW